MTKPYSSGFLNLYLQLLWQRYEKDCFVSCELNVVQTSKAQVLLRLNALAGRLAPVGKKKT